MSNSPDDEAIQIDLSPELREWLHEHADSLDIDPETIVFESLVAYQIAAQNESKLNGDESGLEIGIDAFGDKFTPVIHRAVTDALQGENQEDGTNEVRDALDTHIETVVREQLEETATVEADLAALETDVEARFDELQSDFNEKIEDVRDRVIQVKREADSKAPTDHAHDEFERLDDFESRLDEFEQELESLETSQNELTAQLYEYIDNEDLDSIEEELGTLSERLTTVAWFVKDLREFAENAEDFQGLAELKRRAAAADISRPRCEQCDHRVDIALLTDAVCPHCEAAFSELETPSGLFSAPKLRVKPDPATEDQS